MTKAKTLRARIRKWKRFQDLRKLQDLVELLRPGHLYQVASFCALTCRFTDDDNISLDLSIDNNEYEYLGFEPGSRFLVLKSTRGTNQRWPHVFLLTDDGRKMIATGHLSKAHFQLVK